MVRERRLRRNRRHLAKPAAILGVGVVAAIATSMAMNAAAPLLSVALFVVTAASLLFGANRLGRVIRQNPEPRVEEIECSADEHTLQIGSQRIERSRVAAASVVAHGDGALAQISFRRPFAPRVTLAVEDVEAGERLLDELALGVRQQAATFHAGAPLRARHALVLMALTCLAGVGGMLAFPGPYAPLAMLGFILPFLAFLTPQRVLVGADGIHVTWARRKRFISYGEIADVVEQKALGERVLVIERTNGESHIFPLGTTDELEGSQSLRTRIEAARRNHDQGEIPATEALLARGESRWIEHLRALTDLGQHRRGALVSERLFRILESPMSPAVARAAAAVALGPRASQDDRQRIAEVARSTASTGLRLALEAHEAGDDDALEEALATLELER